MGRGLLATMLAVITAPLHAESFFDGFADPLDGKFDASDYLASARGFLPVPIFITEPAVGYGLGLAVAYFHVPEPLDPESHPHQGPPSISFGFGGYTENDTYFYGGGHSGVWKDDHIRYVGALAKTSLNATWYGLNSGTSAFGEERFNGVEFNIEGEFLLQEIQFRLKETNWWLGMNYVFLDSDVTFDLSGTLPPPIDLPGIAFGVRSAGAGIFVEYDGRNTIFTPTTGTHGELQYTDYGDTWGGDYEYNLAEGEIRHYIPFGDYSHLGLRLDGAAISGDAPFFAYPFVSLRGIPALRYQGDEVLTAEAEYLWGFTPRWSVALFYGAGKTYGISVDNEIDRTVTAGGVGFRYRLARKFGLQAGVDVAKGPEDTTLYLTVGNAW